ncbi:MAG: type II secretion system protein GspE [Myxococcales bacterium]|nr:type II secretion system protein GspE [Myxococcales bacterium]
MNTQDEKSTVVLVDRILARAYSEGASDIHIEPRPREIRVRFRIDGLLVDKPAFDSAFRQKVASRLKVMANLDIAERRLPQDGAFRFRIDEVEVDVRLSTFPTEYGEKVVLRLLPQQDHRLSLTGLGMDTELADQLRLLSQHPHGMLLVTGPTGSGKTSTLYALLQESDSISRNISTLEDPIEYRFEHVIQAQTNPRIGFTFAKGLRAMLRQDPDVIMVGEMRDSETANIAFKAALTGHLVLSTLHTSSAIETFVRLFDMGLERYVVASAINGMLAQRLVRRVCLKCCELAPVDDSSKGLFDAHGIDVSRFPRPRGCDQCNQTGYKGRIGIFELISADDQLKDLVKSEQTSRVQLAEFLHRKGHQGLRVQGLKRVSEGVTTIDEVLRVT